ncbi:MAG: HNH endonuclease [Patescibacteria group bacterium]|nr:HNH endonuclease [Patescibacteria group bacterium]
MQDGEQNHRWKGGCYINSGYVQVRTGTNSYQPEHRLVMEKMLSRKLEIKEVVHHVDRNRSNNHPDNLMLLPSQSEHIKLHLKQGDLAHHAS